MNDLFYQMFTWVPIASIIMFAIFVGQIIFNKLFDEKKKNGYNIIIAIIFFMLVVISEYFIRYY